MRYVIATLLALGVAATAAAPAAFAQIVNEYGNEVIPLQSPGGGGGQPCYVDGAVQSCVQPAPVTLPAPSDSSGVAGPAVPTTGPYNGTPSNNPIPFYGGDTN